jgi:hypothetical protein
MIEAHHGHINPVKNAERSLQGLPGWEPASAASQAGAENGRADAALAPPLMTRKVSGAKVKRRRDRYPKSGSSNV